MKTGRGWFGTMSALSLLALALPARAQEPPTEPVDENVDCATEGVLRFRTGSAKLNGEARQELKALAADLRDDDTRFARLEGYTDGVGSDQANEKLSARRAKAAEKFLAQEGIDSERIRTYARGTSAESPPVSDADKRIVTVQSCERAPEPVAVETPAPEPPPPAPEPEAVAPAPAPEPLPPPAPVPPPDMGAASAGVARSAEEAHLPISKIGMGLTAGGGVIGFNDSRSSDLTDTGGMWEVRLTAGTRLPLALDVAYVGSAQSMNIAGLNTDAYLLGNGAEGALRLQWPTGPVRPFVFGGVGWTHYTIQRTEIAGGLDRQRDDVGTIPLGGGIAASVGRGVFLEVRFTERLAWDDDLLRPLVTSTEDGDLDTWNIGLRLGGEF
jgi:hypothetical protein